MLPIFHNGIFKFFCGATCMNMDSVKKNVINMINLAISFNPSSFTTRQSKYQCLFLRYLIEISLHFIFIGIRLIFLYTSWQGIYLANQTGGKLSCKRCFSLKIMHFYIVFLFLWDKSLKYTISMIPFTENVLKFYYKYFMKTKLKNLWEC